MSVSLRAGCIYGTLSGRHLIYSPLHGGKGKGKREKNGTKAPLTCLFHQKASERDRNFTTLQFNVAYSSTQSCRLYVPFPFLHHLLKNKNAYSFFLYAQGLTHLTASFKHSHSAAAEHSLKTIVHQWCFTVPLPLGQS